VIYSGLRKVVISSAPRRKPACVAEEVISKKAKRAKKGGALEKPNAKVRNYDAHVFVCKGGDCKKRGSKTVRSTLKKELRAQGMNRAVRIDSVECLGHCKHGPNLIVYPKGTWYLGVTERDVTEVVEQHLKNGDPVERLAAELRPRK
jgi:(2Fe-2S) ferredoxin